MPKSILKRVVKIAKVGVFTLGTVVVLAVSAIVLIYGMDAIPELRPCTSTTMGCAADQDGGSCEAGMWRLRPTFCSGP
jgi:hypothetical protein